MRKYIKRQLFELLNMMQEAADTMLTVIVAGNRQEFADILAEQQNAAIAIGNEIESSEGEGTEAVKLLEDYCEELWLLSSEEDVDKMNCHIENLVQILAQTGEKLLEIPEQSDVVFLPYKASMWDCMESVWEAACKDDRYYPIVMPIPYFDLNQGQVTERHYEGEKFPPYVPVADYRNLSLEELQPDIVFVHNAFDNHNLVTSVLPQFYSGKLKEVTRCLVYIPYYVTGEAVYVSHRYLPSYENMNFIVTQSEKMITSYAESIPREKFLPFGSPVADRILKLEKQKPDIPEAWKDMLPNGKDFAGKRTVMLNTSISLLLKERERFLDKIEYIFETAKKTEEVLLVWRPHPLLLATAAVMGEKFVKRLEALKERFVSEKIGVLDETADVGVTVALCNAYLGETASSLIHMFGIARKPRFYINLKVMEGTSEECKTTYEVTDWCEADGKSLLLLDEIGWVVEQDNDTGVMKPFLRIPNRENICGRAYNGMEQKGGELFLYPENALGTLAVDLRTGRMRKEFGVERKSGVIENQVQSVLSSIDVGCLRAIRAMQFEKGNPGREWTENDNCSLEDYFAFLAATEEKELGAKYDAYAFWLANLDGSCGEKVFRAIAESIDEED